MRTFRNEEDALRAWAQLHGYRGAAGGWIYQPDWAFMDEASDEFVPERWKGRAVCQGWATFSRR